MPYATTTELTAYATARGVTLTTDLDVLLTKAHDYIETFDFIGIKTVSTQTDQWPRTNAMVDGVYLASNTVPQGIKDAEMVIAMSIDAGVDPLATIAPSVKREKIDVLEIEYKDSSASTTINPAISAALRKYIVGGGQMRVTRGL